MNKILLLEDDVLLLDIVREYLQEQGFAVTTSQRADEALDLAYEGNFDLLLLDVKVPRGDGFSLLRSLREAHKQTPAIFMTSLNTIQDLTKGYDSGCDDYIKKPFELKELLLRIQSLIKKTYSSHQDIVVITPQASFDIAKDELLIDGKTQKLTAKELLLLKYLLTHKNRLISKDELFGYIWEYEEPSDMSLRVYIKNLRHHLGAKSIETQKGLGYRLCVQ